MFDSLTVVIPAFNEDEALRADGQIAPEDLPALFSLRLAPGWGLV